mgnify:CR=1 FL=1
MEVAAGDAHVGREELAAQHLARLVDQIRYRGLGRAVVVRGEQFGDLLLGLVYGGRDDVRGWLLGELDDVLAQIGLDHLHAVGDQRLVQADLLGDHGLALGHRLRVVTLADFEHDAPRLGRVARPVHVTAGGRDRRLVLLEVVVEVFQDVVLQPLGPLAMPASTSAT